MSKQPLSEKLDQYIDENNLHRSEGRGGLEKLCQIAAALGYKDPMYWGQLSAKATIGDLLCFFEDNSGAVDTVIEWIGNSHSPEWNESISGQLLAVEIDLDDEDIV